MHSFLNGSIFCIMELEKEKAMEKIEILAPAGDLEILKAAVNAGADSVYFGMQALNARRNAVNFTREECTEGIRYCHLMGRKAYLTLNTIMYDNEIPEVIDTIVFAVQSGIDAFIVQDLGVFRLIKEICPDVEIHASTQLSAHNVSDCDMLYELGIKRVVLARELSKDEINRITKQTDIEVEVFIHGALCMSVSGQCYFSSALGERSGNRGLCAQVCRLPFYINNKQNHNLSLKDLSLIDEINTLENIGVKAVKIEGRMKNKHYVVTSIKAIKAAMNNRPYDINQLRDVFSRDGFTKGYYESKLGPEMFGIRKDKDLKKSINAEQKNDRSDCIDTHPIVIDMHYKAFAGKPFMLTIKDQDLNEVTQEGDIVQQAKTRPLAKSEIERQLLKLGASVYRCDKIDGMTDEEIFLTASSINEVRRRACAQLNQIRESASHKVCNTSGTDIKFPKRVYSEKRSIYARFMSIDQMSDEVLDQIDKAYVPLFQFGRLSEKTIDKYRNKLAVELPRVYFGDEKKIITALQQANQIGVEEALCHTIGKIKLAKDVGFSVSAGFGFNITNNLALQEIASLGVKQVVLSCELNFKKIEHISNMIPIGIVAYGHFPLMITRNCPVKIEVGCKKHDCYLNDRKGERFPVVCDNNMCEILNPQPIYYADKKERLEVLDFVLLQFTTESASACSTVFDAYQNSQNITRSNFTRGTYQRKIM